MAPLCEGHDLSIDGVNGSPGSSPSTDVRPSWVLTIETDGVRILAAYALVNPDKLRGIPSLESMPIV